MINRIINEIKVCLNTNCFIAALTTVLTLPDICGKAEYGEWVNDQQGDKRVYNKMRYVKWYNQYVVEYEKNKFPFVKYEKISGELVYNLRNNVLHQATYDVDENKTKVQHFELLAQNINSSRLDSSSCTFVFRTNYNEIIDVKEVVVINITDFCLKMCVCAEKYYLVNKHKFHFMREKFVDMPSNTRQIVLDSDIKCEYDKSLPLDNNLTKTKWDVMY